MHRSSLPAYGRMAHDGANHWLLIWKPGQRNTFYLCSALLAACIIVSYAYADKLWIAYAAQSAEHPAPFGDFFALWSYGKIIASHPATELYNSAALHTLQVALGMAADAQNPFPYPPPFIALFWPLGQLPYSLAYFLWMGVTLALFVWVIFATCSRLPLCIAVAILAPASAVTINSGQSGFLSAALIVAGLHFAGPRPVVSGLLISLLSYKPQLGLLVPVALVAGGYWRTLATACFALLAMALAATLAFGWSIWLAWLNMLPAYSKLFTENALCMKFMPTIIGNLRLMGVASSAADAVQLLVAIMVAAVIWHLFHRFPGRLAVAALLVGTFLATPHAFLYDTPMLIAALALYIEDRLKAVGYLGLSEVLILVAALMFPIPMLVVGLHLPISAVPLLLFFGLITWRARQGVPAMMRLAPSAEQAA